MKFLTLLFIPTIKNNLQFGCAKAPKIDDRKWHCIALILYHLRSLICRQLSRLPNCKLFLIVGIIPFLTATTTQQVFEKYPNAYFIETGSAMGDGIQKALDAGFQTIYSIELAPHYYLQCVERFKNQNQVHLMLGDSSEILETLLQKIDAPATFWLDGHYSWGNTARGKTNTPLLKELEAIRNHPIKTHTLLIDDVRQFGTVEFDFLELEEIIAKIGENIEVKRFNRYEI